MTLPADEQVLRALVDQHGPALLGYAQRLTGGDLGRAEDIVQETLLRAWRHQDSLTGDRGAARPWLFAVARRIAIDAHRRRRARPAEVGEVGEDLLAAVPNAYEDDVERALQGWLVTDALAALSPAHREVLVETFFRDRTVAQAAAVLDVPPGTVKSRTHYALQALRLALAERGVTP